MKKYLLAFIKFLVAITTTYANQNQDTIAIENVNVIPMTKDVVLYKQRVLISGDKILKIEPASSPMKNKNNLIIDGKDKYLIPGFAEMH